MKKNFYLRICPQFIWNERKANVDLIFLSPLFKTKDIQKVWGVIKFNLYQIRQKK